MLHQCPSLRFPVVLKTRIGSIKYYDVCTEVEIRTRRKEVEQINITPGNRTKQKIYGTHDRLLHQTVFSFKPEGVNKSE